MSIIELTDEQQMIRDVARDFAQNEIKPVAAELDREGRFPADLVKKMGELGFMGIFVPEDYGGSGMDTLSYVLALKAIQIHGGYGYTIDYPAERHFRDAKITEIYEGTSEIQRIVIADQVLKELS